MSFGKYPDLSLADARNRRDEARSQLAAGLDPSALRQAEKKAQQAEHAATFEKLAGELLDKKRREEKAPATLAKTEWFHRLLCADLGRMRISQITARDVLAPLRKVEAKGNHESAVRMRSAAGAVFRYAIAVGLADNDPTCGRKRCTVQLSPMRRQQAVCCGQSMDLRDSERLNWPCSCWH